MTSILLVLVMAASGSYVFAGTQPEPADDEVQASLNVAGEGGASEETLTDETQSEEALPSETLPEDATDEVLPEDAAAPEDSAANAEVQSEPAVAAVEDEEEGVSLMAIAGLESIKAPTLNYSTSAKPAWTPLSYAAATDGYIILKVDVTTSGKLWVDIQDADNNTAYTTIDVGTYDPSTNTVTMYSYARQGWLGSSQTQMNGVGGLDVVAGGSYCIAIKSSQSGYIQARPYVYSYATRSLAAGKWMLTSGYKTNYNTTSALHKIKPTKSGYIRVYLKEYGYSSSSGYVTLLNSKKKAVSAKLYFSNGSYPQSVAFGVKKGVTYYLKVTNCVGDSGYQYKYGIKYKIYAAALRTNTAKKEAKTLKRKAKYISAVMPATGKSGNQWFKFKVTKKRATRFTIDAKNIKSGKTTVTVYCGKKKVGSATLSNGKVNPFDVTYSNKYGKAKKGTYYVKITKSAKANGAYRIRYVK